jgi:hypothetical protein
MRFVNPNLMIDDQRRTRWLDQNADKLLYYHRNDYLSLYDFVEKNNSKDARTLRYGYYL